MTLWWNSNGLPKKALFRFVDSPFFMIPYTVLFWTIAPPFILLALLLLGFGWLLLVAVGRGKDIMKSPFTYRSQKGTS